MTWLDTLKILVPVVILLLGWLLNEYSKRQSERLKAKEERYIALLESLDGFYVSANPETATEDKEKFLEQLRLCWMYCPDSVIRKGYNFIDHVSVGVRKSDKEKEAALGSFVVEVRKDLLGKTPWLRSRTKLQASDYRHLKST